MSALSGLGEKAGGLLHNKWVWIAIAGGAGVFVLYKFVFSSSSSGSATTAAQTLSTTPVTQSPGTTGTTTDAAALQLDADIQALSAQLGALNFGGIPPSSTPPSIPPTQPLSPYAPGVPFAPVPGGPGSTAPVTPTVSGFVPAPPQQLAGPTVLGTVTATGTGLHSTTTFLTNPLEPYLQAPVSIQTYKPGTGGATKSTTPVTHYSVTPSTTGAAHPKVAITSAAQVRKGLPPQIRRAA